MAKNDPVVTKSVLDASLKEFGKSLADGITKNVTKDVTKSVTEDIGSIIADFSDRVDERFNRLETKVEKNSQDIQRILICRVGI